MSKQKFGVPILRSSLFPANIALSGQWLYRADPLDLGEHYPEQLAYTHADDARWMDAHHNEGDWKTTSIPGRWPVESVSENKTIWFRRSFAAPAHEGRAALVFDGVNYFSDFWLNGHYLGSHEGYMARIRLDVTGLLRPRNVLVVKVRAPHDVNGQEDQMNQLKRHFVGALGRWDMNDPESKPAGIWGDVSLELQGEAGIDSASLRYDIVELPDRADRDQLVPVRAALQLSLGALTNARNKVTSVRWTITPRGFGDNSITGESEVLLISGGRNITMDIALQARLWWTWDLGHARLYDVSIELMLDGKVTTDRRVWRTGFRDLRLGEGWDLKLNGLSLYQRGANYLSDLDLSTMTDDRYRTDIELFRRANLNTVHPFCLMENDGLYRACDEAGLIVYQDFPLWLMADTSSDFVLRALGQFDDMLDRLGASPSVAIWNFGSQPSIANVDKLCLALVRHARSADPSRIAHLGNAAVSYEDHDDTHPVTSFFWSEENALRFERDYGWRRDCHMYPGWYFSDIAAIRERPRSHFGLVTEFGAQALPNAENLGTFLDLDGPIDWRTIARRCGQPVLIQRHNPDVSDVRALIASSQRYQSELLRHHTEYIRSLKGRPGRGLHVFAFNDCWSSVTWSMVDYDRVPKPSYYAVANAMAPVQAFLTTYRDGLASGANALPFSLVNDGPDPLHDLVLHVQILSNDTVLADEKVLVAVLGTDSALDVVLTLDLPEGGQPTKLVSVLSDIESRVLATNIYELGPDALSHRPSGKDA